MAWVPVTIKGSPGIIENVMYFNGPCGVRDTQDEINAMGRLDQGTLTFHPRNIWSPKYTDAFKNDFSALNKSINMGDCKIVGNQL
jgi:hypothetical protein